MRFPATPLLLAVLGLAALAAAPGRDEDPRPRVVLRVNRNVEVAGFVEYEDTDLIVVRSPDHPEGEPQSFVKTRVLQIVRLTAPEPGQRGVVLLRNGQLRDGVIIEDTFDHVLLEIEGIRAELRRDVVDHVRLEPTFEQRLADFRAAIKPGMDRERLHLCRWLVEEHRYELARAELKALVDERPEISEAGRLLKIVEAQLELMRKDEARARAAAEAPVDAGPDASEPAPARTAPVVSGPPIDVLSQDDVNIIRVFEVDFDHPPKISVKPDLIRSMIERYSTSPLIPEDQTRRTALFRADPVDIVRLLFELKARDLYPQIEVLSEPRALNMFRQRVHDSWLMNSCATSRCHGGEDGGRLILHRRYYKDPRVRYANLLILEQLEVDPQWPLINYAEAEMSLIIQYGLPRDQARLPHPPTRGWKPIFGRGTDRLRQDTIQWIESMMRPRPIYPLEGLGAEPAPAPERGLFDEPPR